jgi:hypothetical protein
MKYGHELLFHLRPLQKRPATIPRRQAERDPKSGTTPILPWKFAER